MISSPMRRTYGEVWGRGPRSLTVDIADEGLVNVASADEAVAHMVRQVFSRVVVVVYIYL
jgi:hypothetical protein